MDRGHPRPWFLALSNTTSGRYGVLLLLSPASHLLLPCPAFAAFPGGKRQTRNHKLSSLEYAGLHSRNSELDQSPAYSGPMG